MDKIYLMGASIYFWWILDDVKAGIFEWKDIAYEEIKAWKEINKIIKVS